jgi:hypothetical protein
LVGVHEDSLDLDFVLAAGDNFRFDEHLAHDPGLLAVGEVEATGAEPGPDEGCDADLDGMVEEKGLEPALEKHLFLLCIRGPEVNYGTELLLSPEVADPPFVFGEGVQKGLVAALGGGVQLQR